MRPCRAAARAPRRPLAIGAAALVAAGVVALPPSHRAKRAVPATPAGRGVEHASVPGRSASCLATAHSLTPTSFTPPTPANSVGAAPRTTAPTGEPLRTVADLPLPGPAARFDYQSLDAAAGRLYIAHMGAGRLVVVDVRARAVVASVPGFPGATGVLAVPALHRVYVSAAGRHEVDAVDDRTLAIVARIPAPSFPDGLAYAPEAHRVFVSDERAGVDLAVDAARDTLVAAIPLGGEAGNTHYDPVSRCILVAEQTHGQLVAIDPELAQVAARYDLTGGRGAHGFLVDEPRRVAYVTSEASARLLAVDLRTMRVTATYATGETPDVLALDAGLGRLYVAAEGGSVSVFAQEGMGLRPLGVLRMPHAHSVAVDPTTHLVYLPLENVDGRPVLRIMMPAG